VLQQLPEGHYTPFRIVMGADRVTTFKADTFFVHKGSITSLGLLDIHPELDFMGFMTKLVIATRYDSLTPLVKDIRAHRIDTLPIQHRILKWAVTKD
jgi:hypothetical protein